MLRLTVKVGQSVEIAGVGTIHVGEKSGRCVNLGFDVEQGPIKIVLAESRERPTPTRLDAADAKANAESLFKPKPGLGR
ncbi:hypothetical protein [Sinorhizobium meliloti]|uniref:hypothetical protein n=1 Tax=Rhizobium meliloti TaxID=382 RepID=UPI003F1896F9